MRAIQKRWKVTSELNVSEPGKHREAAEATNFSQDREQALYYGSAVSLPTASDCSHQLSASLRPPAIQHDRRIPLNMPLSYKNVSYKIYKRLGLYGSIAHAHTDVQTSDL